MKRLIVAVLCIFFIALFGPLTMSADWSGWYYGGEMSGVHGNPVVNWYDVSQWEVDVCFEWGGTTDPNEVSQNNIAGDYYHNLIVTLQAEVSDPLSEEAVTSGKRLYETAWFIQPTEADETVNFEVYIYDSGGHGEVLESTSANYINGFRGYDVRESEKNYTRAKILYQRGVQPQKELEVEFVE